MYLELFMESVSHESQASLDFSEYDSRNHEQGKMKKLSLMKSSM